MTLPPPPPDHSDPRDYVLELTCMNSPAAAIEAGNSELETRPVPYLSILFKCCQVYAPIYRNAAATAFAGHCPRCQRPTSIAISPSGSRSRIFQAE